MGNTLPRNNDGHDSVEWWIISSQTCNLYHFDFEKISVFELVAANRIDQCDPGKIKGDNARILHVEAQSEDKVVAFEIDIQKRRWLPRRLLATLPAPTGKLQDDHGGISKWLDIFSGWLALSYVRATLPDEFNDAIKKAKITSVLQDKLSKKKNELYGIYLSIDSDADKPWSGALGEMPPPYLLEILLVTEVDSDPLPMKSMLIEKLFTETIPDPNNSSNKVTRADLAKQYGVRIIEESINSKSVTEVSLHEIKSYIRYTNVDHLSDSSMAAPI